MNYTRIFISQYSDDLDKAVELQNYIKRQAYLEPILVVKEPHPDVLIEKQVEEGIKSANYFVSIITSCSSKSVWVNQEIGYARGTKRPIYALIEDEIHDKITGFIHKQHEQFIFGKTSFKKKYIELINLIKENEGIGKPPYNKKVFESKGDDAFNIDINQVINKETILHIKVNLSNSSQEFVIYFMLGSESPENEFKYMGFSNTNNISNIDPSIRGTEHNYQIDVPGKTRYKYSVNIFNAINQSSLIFKKFPNVIKQVRVRNINGEEGQPNIFFYAFTCKLKLNTNKKNQKEY